MAIRFQFAGAASIGIASATGPVWSATQEQGTPVDKGAGNFAVSARDKTVNPGESFFRYANGNWDKNTPISADKPAM